jgi:hypothetical protein
VIHNTSSELANGMNEYVSGGYYVVKTIPRPSGVSEVLPDTLLTLSSCFTTVVTDIVQLQWDKFENVREAIAEEARELGIPETKIPELVVWAKAQHNSNYHVYSDVEPALDLLDQFITDRTTHVVGIGLHKSLLESFNSQLTKDVNNGLGLVELVNEGRSPAEGGSALGFEPLGFEATKFHSWLCHRAPDEMYKRFSVRLNRLGLIEKLNDARQVNEYLLETGAEPAIWEPWLLLDYARKRTADLHEPS